MLNRKRDRYRYLGRQNAALPSLNRPHVLPACDKGCDDSLAVIVCDDPLVFEALRFIAAHRRHALQVNDVAEHVGVSRSTLIRRFKSAMGRSVLSEIDRQRVAELKRLLMRPGHSIAAISAMCGFSGSSQLSRYFKRAAGVTPSEYRRGKRVPERALVYGSR